MEQKKNIDEKKMSAAKKKKKKVRRKTWREAWKDGEDISPISFKILDMLKGSQQSTNCYVNRSLSCWQMCLVNSLCYVDRCVVLA